MGLAARLAEKHDGTMKIEVFVCVMLAAVLAAAAAFGLWQAFALYGRDAWMG